MNQVIIMADIVGSSQKSGAQLMKTFSHDVGRINEVFAKSILSPLTITLGDEYQGVVSDIAAAAGIIFRLDEFALVADPSYRLRHVIVYGKIDTPLNSAEAHGMLGPGLTRARELLNEMKKHDREVIIEGFGERTDRLLELAFVLYRGLYTDWHEKDRKVAFDFIQQRDYKIMAEIYGKDPSTMWRKEHSLKMSEFYAARELITLLVSDGTVS